MDFIFADNLLSYITEFSLSSRFPTFFRAIAQKQGLRP